MQDELSPVFAQYRRRNGEIILSNLSCCSNDKHSVKKEEVLITTRGINNSKSQKSMTSGG